MGMGKFSEYFDSFPGLPFMDQGHAVAREVLSLAFPPRQDDPMGEQAVEDVEKLTKVAFKEVKLQYGALTSVIPQYTQWWLSGLLSGFTAQGVGYLHEITHDDVELTEQLLKQMQEHVSDSLPAFGNLSDSTLDIFSLANSFNMSDELSQWLAISLFHTQKDPALINTYVSSALFYACACAQLRFCVDL